MRGIFEKPSLPPSLPPSLLPYDSMLDYGRLTTNPPSLPPSLPRVDDFNLVGGREPMCFDYDVGFDEGGKVRKGGTEGRRDGGTEGRRIGRMKGERGREGGREDKGIHSHGFFSLLLLYSGDSPALGHVHGRRRRCG